MLQAEENFMAARNAMESAIETFYNNCGEKLK